MCVLYAISIYIIYRIYELLLRLLISLEFCFRACVLDVRLVQKRRLQDVYATVLRHCQSAADQSCSIHQRCASVITNLHFVDPGVKITQGCHGSWKVMKSHGI